MADRLAGARRAEERQGCTSVATSAFPSSWLVGFHSDLLFTPLHYLLSPPSFPFFILIVSHDLFLALSLAFAKNTIRHFETIYFISSDTLKSPINIGKSFTFLLNIAVLSFPLVFFSLFLAKS